jgi:hypothetical protein
MPLKTTNWTVLTLKNIELLLTVRVHVVNTVNAIYQEKIFHGILCLDTSFDSDGSNDYALPPDASQVTAKTTYYSSSVLPRDRNFVQILNSEILRFLSTLSTVF